MGLSAYELFDEAIQKSQGWLNELRDELEWDQPNGVLAALRSTPCAIGSRRRRRPSSVPSCRS